jgi:hypothetical protein
LLFIHRAHSLYRDNIPLILGQGSSIGYSDFHNLMGLTRKRCLIIFFTMFVKKVFQLVKPFLANLHSSSSKNTHILYVLNNPRIFVFLFPYEYQKYAEFYADFKSGEIIEKSAPRKICLLKAFVLL